MGTFVTSILFFAVNPAFGKVNDAVSVVQMVVTLPVAAAMALLTYPVNGALAWLALAVGSLGMASGAAMGLWLILSNALSGLGGVLPLGLGACGMVAGAGYLLMAVGFYRGGQQHPLFYAGGLLTVIGYSIWAVWLGRLLLVGALASAAI